MNEHQPWLENKKWASKEIASGAKIKQYFLWGFAIVWNLISLPILFQSEEILTDIARKPEAALAFLFPLVGLGLLLTALKMTLRWRKFGPTPLILDPFPGSLGGHVGGSIDTNIAYTGSQKCAVTVSCIHSYTSGSGKNRSRHENVNWQSEGLCHFEPSAKGTRYSFRFDVPSDQHPSDIKASSSYHLWRVVVEAEMEEVDFSRRFDIPVFATGQHSRHIHNGTEDFHGTIDRASSGVEEVADIRSIPGGVEAFFSAFQRPGSGIMMSTVGSIFGGIGIGVAYNSGIDILSMAFVVMGSLTLLMGIYSLGKSLLISVTPTEVKARRFLFGIPLTTRRITAQDFKGFDIVQAGTMSTGSKTVVYYCLNAMGDNKKKFAVAERLKSRAEVELIKDCFEAYLRGE